MKEFKIIGIISSANFNGNTAKLMREALKAAEDEGAVTKEIFLPKLHLDFCTGCLKCLKNGSCSIPDDFMELRKELYAADGIIWGSPTYCGAPNALMKNLIDRLGMYEVMTSSLGGKYIASISTAGSTMAAKKVAKGLSSITSSGAFKRAYVSGSLGAGFVHGKLPSEDKNTLQRARELGRKISKDIKDSKSYPLQNLFARFINKAVIRPQFTKYILKQKDDNTKAVYDNLVKRSLIDVLPQ